VESSCKFGIETSGSMKCFELSSGLTSSGLSGVLSSILLVFNSHVRCKYIDTRATLTYLDAGLQKILRIAKSILKLLE
jgi:hypothetical protein